MAIRQKTMLPQPPSGQVSRRTRWPATLALGVAAEGTALAVLLGLDGSPLWRVLRVLVVITATSLGVWGIRHAGRSGRGATALVAGIVGTVAGAGVATAHLAKAGLDAAALCAGIVLVTGLLLLIVGAAALVRAIPGWWRLLAVPAGLVLLWFAVFPLTTAVYATNLPPALLGSATRASYGLAYAVTVPALPWVATGLLITASLALAAGAVLIAVPGRRAVR